MPQATRRAEGDALIDGVTFAQVTVFKVTTWTNLLQSRDSG
jgi:hypothetical protein